MAKNKLKKFSELKGYQNVFEPNVEDLQSKFDLKGNWNKLVFKNEQPIVLELGCGKGEYSVGLAKKYPEKSSGIDFRSVDFTSTKVICGKILTR